MFTKDTVFNQPRFVGIGLICARVCAALDKGLERGQLDGRNQSVLIAIDKLNTSVELHYV